MSRATNGIGQGYQPTLHFVARGGVSYRMDPDAKQNAMAEGDVRIHDSSRLGPRTAFATRDQTCI